MKEVVHRPQRPWLVGVAVAVIAVAYFVFLATSKHREPGANLVLDIKEFEDLDKIETDFSEVGAFKPGVQNPQALAVAGGKLYVAGDNAVVVLDENHAEIATYAIEGAPNCLGVAPDGTIYAGLSTKVLVLDASGAKIGEWTDFTPRSFITAIAADDSNVFVADAGNRVVARFDRAGTRLGEIGKKDESRDIPGLEVPSPYLDLALNPDGELWIVNPGRLGIERYMADGSLVTAWYRPSFQLNGFPGCCNPTHIAFSPDGRLITSEKGLIRLKRFEVTTGEFEGLVAGSSLFPRQQSLRDVVVDDKDRILVLDRPGDAIRVFAHKEAELGQSDQSA